MHNRNFLVKQFEEFGKILGVIFSLKRDGKMHKLNDLIKTTALKYTNSEIDLVLEIPDTFLIEILTHEKKLTDDQLKMLADLLYEKANFNLKIYRDNDIEDLNGFKKALLIYLFLEHQSTLSFSLDMHYKLEVLKKMDIKPNLHLKP